MSDTLARKTIDQLGPKGLLSVRLTVVEGPSIGQEFKFDGSASIGRAPDATVMVDDVGVSRQHARVRRLAGGGFEIQDLGSKNGTFLNGERIERATVALGDKLRIGPRVVLSLTSFDQVEEQLIQRQRLETIGRLGAGIAHDLNNVLAALHAGTAFLEQLAGSTRLADPRVRECLKDLTLATVQGAELTRGILRFVRGKRSLREAVDVSDLVTDVTRLLRHTLDHSVRIETHVDSGVIAYGNHSELQQILLNLCLNARDAMPNGGVLRVTAELSLPPESLGSDAARPAALLAVADTGTGIEPEVRARIFEPFFTTKREGAGHGIGLSTVRDLVKLHGGRITLDTVPGQGSVFRIYLPSMDVQTFAATGERAPLERPWKADRSINVLLVDDEQLVRRSFGRLLRQHGLHVTEAANGEEALTLYEAGQHDLVIMDLDMPGMSGEEAQRHLMARSPSARVMFASGHDDPQREALVRERGARAYLQKPYEISTLIATIRDILRDDAFPEEKTRVEEKTHV